jgi:hypothetical protein
MGKMQLRGGNGDGEDDDLFGPRQKRPRPRERGGRVDLSNLDLLNLEGNMLSEPMESQNQQDTVIEVTPSHERPNRTINRSVVIGMVVLFVVACVLLFAVQTSVWLATAIIVSFLWAGATIKSTLVTSIKRMARAKITVAVTVLTLIGAVQVLTFADGGLVWRATTMVGIVCGLFAFLASVARRPHTTTIEVTKY